MAKRGKWSDPHKLPKDHTIDSLGSEAWNVADGYMKLKVLRQLIQIDRFENIALYGSDDMDDATDLPYDNNNLNLRRFEAFKRLISMLRQLISNTRFAIKSGHLSRIENFLERIRNVEAVSDNVIIVRENFVTHEVEVEVNDDHFNNCIAVLQSIKTELNFPLNKAGLIFKQGDEVDLDQIMKDIIDGG